MNDNHIGVNLKKYRLQKGFSQKELCEGLCSQAEVSKIENGLNSPTVELLQQLAMRLQIPITLLFQEHLKEEYLFHFDQTLTLLVREEKYEEALKIINEASTDVIYETRIIKVYLKTVIELKQKLIDFRTAASILSSLIDKEDIWSSSVELFVRIKMAIANMYSEQYQFHLTEVVYEELERKLESFQSITFLNTLLKIYYNHCQVLSNQGKYEESIQIANKGYNLCLAHNNSFLFGHFYYQLAHYEEISKVSSELIKRDYTVAYALFHALDHDIRKKMILEMKSDVLLFSFNEYSINSVDK